MDNNKQNTKYAFITEKTLIIGINVGSETHYARAFDWRNYELVKTSGVQQHGIRFSDIENMDGGYCRKTWQNGCNFRNRDDRTLLVCTWKFPSGHRNEVSRNELQGGFTSAFRNVSETEKYYPFGSFC